jgi:hypothetical protein
MAYTIMKRGIYVYTLPVLYISIQSRKKKLKHIYNKEKLLVITSDSKELKEKLGGSDIDEIYTNHYNFCHKTEKNL